MPDSSPFRSAKEHVAESRPVTKEEIGRQLASYAAEHKLKPLEHRLVVGLNEVGILAYEKTRRMVEELCQKMATDKKDAEMILRNLEDMAADMQENGPWEYTKELVRANSPEVKMWYILNGAASIGYEKEMELNNWMDYKEQLKRIEGLLQKALENPEAFVVEAKEHALKVNEALIRPLYAKNEKGKDILEPDDTVVLCGESLGSFIPMALNGREVGVVQDAYGTIFVGTRGRISDELVESCGLTGKMIQDPKNPSRKVMGFYNDKGTLVARRLHRGFLIIDNKSLELAQTIAAGVRDDLEAIEVADSAIEHTRIIQTTEKEYEANERADREHWERKQWLRDQGSGAEQGAAIETTALSHPREEFYSQMLYVRGMYVYLDALEKLRRDRRKQAIEKLRLEREKKGKKLSDEDLDSIRVVITERDRELVSKDIWEKMKQKVDELRYVNSLVEEYLPKISEDAHSVIDMAGGAGDLGLAVGSELMSRGRTIDDIEIVDPQPGIEDFMHNLIDHLPFRDELRRHAHHNNGYLQDAHIGPDSIVVAKHACGTLTDAIIDQFIKSESPMLIAMTCCQDKAKDAPAPYAGFSQQHWHDTCLISGLTSTDLPDSEGKAMEIAKRKIEQGQAAMYELDMARVEHLRRNGFAAELRINREFPKGDVIIARRLPKDFMDKLDELKTLETSEDQDDRMKFDNELQKLDKLVRTGKGAAGYGKKWTKDDFAELRERLSPMYEEKRREADQKVAGQAMEIYREKAAAKEKAAIEAREAAKKKEEKDRREALLKQIFADSQGKQNTYITQRAKQTGRPIPKERMGTVMGIINTLIQESSGEEPSAIRANIDAKLEEMGF